MSPTDESDQSVLDYGDEAVSRPIEAILDDRAAAIPFDKRKKKPKRKRGRGETIVIVAAGFSAYTDDAKEIAAIKANKWTPQTKDFQATASSNAFGAENAEYFFGALAGSPGKIGRIVFIGHGSPSKLGLSGHLEGSVTRFDEFIDADTLDLWKGLIDREIVPKLDENATIDIVACEVALGRSFIEKLTTTFNRCVRAFSGPVYWKYPISEDETSIEGRGRVSSDNVNFRKGYKRLSFPEPVCPPKP